MNSETNLRWQRGRPGADFDGAAAALVFRIRPTAVVLPMAAIMLALTMLAVTLPVTASLTGRDVGSATFRILDFRQEANIPTLLSTFELAFASVLLFLIGRIAWRQDRRHAVWWYALALAFAFLTIDESALIHETLNHFPLGVGGSLAILDRFPWVWFYGFVAMAAGLAFVSFLWGLPRPTAATFVVSGGLYLVGAIGLEVFGAYQIVSLEIDRRDLAYILRGVAEEFCEMSGILLFIWGLLGYLGRMEKRVTFGFESGAAGRVGI